jgi:hypothetical protein
MGAINCSDNNLWRDLIIKEHPFSENLVIYTQVH